jgi:hypothetical protein
MQGTAVDVSSTMPSIISQSTFAAAYYSCALATMHHTTSGKIYNEFYGFDPDYNITIPIGIDSQSAIDTANSFRETQRTKHIARRFHFVRFAIGCSQSVLFKTDGTENFTNSLTKPLTADQLASETTIYEVEVEP